MKLLHQASAGTEDKEDIKVTLSPAGRGIAITVHSTVQALFGAQIEAAARELLEHYGIDGCEMEIEDRSALDYVVRARVETAIRRAAGGAL